MDKELKQVFFSNALNLIKQERRKARRIYEVYARLHQLQVRGGITENILSNPFIKTALSILKTFVGNYKIKQAIKLLQEAAEEGD